MVRFQPTMSFGANDTKFERRRSVRVSGPVLHDQPLRPWGILVSCPNNPQAPTNFLHPAIAKALLLGVAPRVLPPHRADTRRGAVIFGGKADADTLEIHRNPAELIVGHQRSTAVRRVAYHLGFLPQSSPWPRACSAEILERRVRPCSRQHVCRNLVPENKINEYLNVSYM